ncbi:MAG: hypothetical protein J6564_09700 [Gilliamella sp.]|uniref:hypothetical protein n=1 Tax=Gilliamella sp. TaxID=1891236 RepID=UPI0025E49060|nr:hypothetical protein [Gilliamella sp.]MCO6546073.1 hypothetical protein [Gilliamella sp.]
MYIGEFILWLGSAIKPETRKKLKKDYSDNSMKLSEVAKDYTKESVSHILIHWRNLNWNLITMWIGLIIIDFIQH